MPEAAFTENKYTQNFGEWENQAGKDHLILISSATLETVKAQTLSTEAQSPLERSQTQSAVQNPCVLFLIIFCENFLITKAFSNPQNRA